MEYLKIKNWDKFQHCKHRKPPWIKLYVDILDKYDENGVPKKFYTLKLDTKLIFIMLLCLSSRFNNNIPYNGDLSQLLGIPVSNENIESLVSCGYIEIISDASILASNHASNLAPNMLVTETETEYREHKKISSYELPSKEIITESSIPRIKELISELSDELYYSGIWKEVHMYKNTMLKRSQNERAVLYTLIAIYNNKPKEPWGYCLAILKKENANFNEQDFQKDQ